MQNDKQNGWSEWSRHVLKELERLNACYESLRKDVSKIQVEIGMLKVRAGIFGIIGGAIPAIVMLILMFLRAQ